MSATRGGRRGTCRWLAVRLGGLTLGAAALTFLCGCPWWGLLADAANYEQSLDHWLEQAQAGPNINVRIVNNTDVVANVVLAAASLAPPYPDTLFYPGSDESYYYTIESRSLLINAQGTATGTIKCAEVIGVTASAPYDLSADMIGYYDYSYSDSDQTYDLYLSSGNCALTGVGVAAETEFTGDIFTLVRYVRQVEDGLDCTTQTLVITIETAGTAAVVDPQTGEVTASATLGAATISLE